MSIDRGSLRVTLADRERLLEKFETEQGVLDLDMPRAIEHEGVEIGCCECCSVIYYRHNGQWYTLPGAD